MDHHGGLVVQTIPPVETWSRNRTPNIVPIDQQCEEYGLVIDQTILYDQCRASQLRLLPFDLVDQVVVVSPPPTGWLTPAAEGRK